MSRCALRGASVAAAAVLTLLACANGGDAEADLEAIVPSDLDAGDGVRSSSPDGARPRSDGAGVPDPDPRDGDDGGDDGACTGKVVLNELLPEGAGGAEFVELYNPNGCAVSLGGWKLLYRSKSDGASAAPLHTFATNFKSLAAKSFLVLGTSGVAESEITIGGGLGNAGGQVGLVDDAGKLVDAIGYGATTAGTYVENKPVALPPAGSSVGRKSDGVDTDDNAADWKVFSQPSPGAPN